MLYWEKGYIKSNWYFVYFRARRYSYLLWTSNRTRDHGGGGVSRAVGVGRAVGVITVALVVAGKTGIDGASTELISRGTLVPLVVIYTVFVIQLAESAEQENSQQARNCSMLLIWSQSQTSPGGGVIPSSGQNLVQTRHACMMPWTCITLWSTPSASSSCQYQQECS